MSVDGKPLEVIIIGAGFCGLTTAIECKLHGLNPLIIDAYAGPSSHGDLLDFVTNAGRVFMRWDDGAVGKKLFESGVNAAKTLDIYNSKNELLRTDEWPQGAELYGVFAGHRGLMHKIVFDYAAHIGVRMHGGDRVVKYIVEDDRKGVVTQSGKEFFGNVVLAADGPRSLARSQLLHLTESKVNSGYAIFRAFFEVDEKFRKHPILKELVKDDEDVTKFWVGPDMHGFIYVWNKGRDCAWVLTHKDEADIAESWSESAKRDDVYPFLDAAGFPEIWRALVQITPEDRLIDYKLVWRAPLTTWLTADKHCALMGDAAHCHHPTSAQGACQAVEDAVTAAICLEQVKSAQDIPIAMQVFERIRFNRSHVIHQASISTRNIYHKNNWTPALIQENPGALVIPLLDWVIEHDPIKTAEENYDRLAEDVRAGKPGSIQELALPAGGNYDSMNVKDSAIENGDGLPIQSIDPPKSSLLGSRKQASG